MKFLVVFLSFFISTNALALTPGELKELIYKRSLKIRLKREQVNEQRFQKEQTLRSYFPKLTLSADYTEFYPDMFHNWNQDISYGVNLSAEPVNLQRNVQLKIDSESLRKLRYSLDSTLLDVYSDALSRLYELKILEKKIELRKKQLESSRKILSVAQEKLKHGLVMITDVLKANSEVARRESLLSQAQNEYRKVFNSLNALLDFSLEDGEKPEVNLVEERIPINTSNLVSRAMLMRPEIKEAKEQVQIAEKSVLLAKRTLSPRLSISLSAQRTGTELPGSKNYSAGFTLSFPVFDSGLTKARTLEKMSQLKQSELQLREVENSVKLEVLNAISDVNSSYQQLKASAASLKYARRAYERVLNEYKLGVSDIVALLQTFQAYCQSQEDYLQALLNYNLAIVSLRKATGELIGGEN